MGNLGCFSGLQSQETAIFTQAEKIYKKIDRESKNYIDASDIESYFGSYAMSYYKILLREMNFKKDGVVSKNEWMAYWQYVRRAGYSSVRIEKCLDKIEEGELELNFPNAKEYQSEQPRETVYMTILDDMRRKPSNLPFLMEES